MFGHYFQKILNHFFSLPLPFSILPQALNNFKDAAENGVVLAQYKLAEMYFIGETGSQDYENAFKWFKKAAEQGLVEAQYNTAVCYADGLGIKKSSAEASETLAQIV